MPNFIYAASVQHLIQLYDVSKKAVEQKHTREQQSHKMIKGNKLPVTGRGMPSMAVLQAQHNLLVRNSSVSYTLQ